MIYDQIDYDPSRHVLLFIHIPKTGGSSLGRSIAEALGAEAGDRSRRGVDRGGTASFPGVYRSLAMQWMESQERGPHYWAEILRRRLKHLRDEAREEGLRLAGRPSASVDEVFAMGGHVRLGSVRTGRRRPLPFTLVRDPVDRLVSGYYYARDRVQLGGSAGSSRKKVRAMSHDFAGYAEALLADAGRRDMNWQCRYLARRGDFESARRAVDEQCLLAGPTDRMGRFMELLGAKLGVNPGPERRANAGRSRPADFEAPPELRARLEAAMADDVKLYRHVSAEFAALSDRVPAAGA